MHGGHETWGSQLIITSLFSQPSSQTAPCCGMIQLIISWLFCEEYDWDNE